MNFFGHYFLDHKINNPIHNFGLLTPDLLRNFTPSEYDKKLIHKKLLNKDWENGIQLHFQRDKNFHTSIFFDLVYNACHEFTKSKFQEAQIPRFWFALHVLIEMVLDKVLIQQDENKLDQFYEQLTICIPEIPDLLKQVNHSNTKLFLDKYQRFLDSKYLYKYLESEGIAYGLNRIYFQVNAYNEDWNKIQKQNLIEVILLIENTILLNITKLNS